MPGRQRVLRDFCGAQGQLLEREPELVPYDMAPQGAPPGSARMYFLSFLAASSLKATAPKYFLAL